MERTPDRCALHFSHDFNTHTPSDPRRRPPSLILFSLGLNARHVTHATSTKDKSQRTLAPSARERAPRATRRSAPTELRLASGRADHVGLTARERRVCGVPRRASARETRRDATSAARGVLAYTRSSMGRARPHFRRPSASHRSESLYRGDRLSGIRSRRGVAVAHSTVAPRGQRLPPHHTRA